MNEKCTKSAQNTFKQLLCLKSWKNQRSRRMLIYKSYVTETSRQSCETSKLISLIPLTIFLWLFLLLFWLCVFNKNNLVLLKLVAIIQGVPPKMSVLTTNSGNNGHFFGTPCTFYFATRYSLVLFYFLYTGMWLEGEISIGIPESLYWQYWTVPPTWLDSNIYCTHIFC